MRHFYAPNISPEDNIYKMDSDESKHVVKVLRLKEGDEIALLNGQGHIFRTRIALASQKSCELEIIDFEFQERPAYDIHIAVAPTKQTERMEWFIEKATELGATQITFLDTKNGERAQYKYDRFERKMISAFKQSRRHYMPLLSHNIVPFDQFIEQNPNGLIAHCYEQERMEFGSVFQTSDCPVLIGPEGDFTLEEVKSAQEKGYKAISLGNTRLRTETAAFYACALMKYHCE